MCRDFVDAAVQLSRPLAALLWQPLASPSVSHSRCSRRLLPLWSPLCPPSPRAPRARAVTKAARLSGLFGSSAGHHRISVPSSTLCLVPLMPIRPLPASCEAHSFTRYSRPLRSTAGCHRTILSLSITTSLPPVTDLALSRRSSNQSKPEATFGRQQLQSIASVRVTIDPAHSA